MQQMGFLESEGKYSEKDQITSAKKKYTANTKNILLAIAIGISYLNKIFLLCMQLNDGKCKGWIFNWLR